MSYKTFESVNKFGKMLMLGDYKGMSRVLCQMGATDEEVELTDLRRYI